MAPSPGGPASLGPRSTELGWPLSMGNRFAGQEGPGACTRGVSWEHGGPRAPREEPDITLDMHPTLLFGLVLGFLFLGSFLLGSCTHYRWFQSSPLALDLAICKTRGLDCMSQKLPLNEALVDPGKWGGAD